MYMYLNTSYNECYEENMLVSREHLTQGSNHIQPWNEGYFSESTMSGELVGMDKGRRLEGEGKFQVENGP